MRRLPCVRLKSNFFVLGLLSAVCLGAPLSLGLAESYTVGVSIPLTGSAASYGSDMKNAMLFANDELAAGRFNFIFEDDACSAKTALTVANKLINVSHVKQVIGFACSGAMLAASPVYSKAGVLQITSSASAASIANLGSLVFRTFPSDYLAAEKLFHHLKKNHKTVGMISEETEYTQEFIQSFEGLNSKKVISLVNENALPGTSDFRPSLLKLKQQKLEALVINAQYDGTFLEMLKQVRELQMDLPIYGIYWPSSRTLLEKAASILEGVEFVDIPGPDDVLTKNGRALYQKYVEKFGEPNTLPLLVATTLESVRALDAALTAGGDPVDYLNREKFSGMFGGWFFDVHGEIQGLEPVIKVIKDGKPRLMVR
jgi:branched-chain amino acid transport system substrate-binding protein